jgi:putative ABC transport system permease protein
LRDLARHQARSSAALAAISLALAVPALVVIADAANAKASEATAAGGNLSDADHDPGRRAGPHADP